MNLLILSFLLLVSITQFVDSKKCECGIHQGSNNARIFNGQDAEEKRHPWNILIEITPLDENDQVVKSEMGEFGGVLISKRHVLTSQHGMLYDSKGRLQNSVQKFKGIIWAGLYRYQDTENENRDKGRVQKRSFKNKHVRPYKKFKKKHVKKKEQYFFVDDDIALITLESNRGFTFTPTVNPICLPYKNPKIHKIDTSWYETDVHFTGFGYVDQQENDPEVLQYAKFTIVNSEKCFREHSKIPFPKKWNSLKKKGFCAMGTQGDIMETNGLKMKIRKHLQMACQGDSGGAAIWEDEEEHRSFVIGINDSGGEVCGEKPIIPDTFQSIPGKISKWIVAKGGDDVKECLLVK